jgi:hypothetical protein
VNVSPSLEQFDVLWLGTIEELISFPVLLVLFCSHRQNTCSLDKWLHIQLALILVLCQLIQVFVHEDHANKDVEL